MQKVKIAGLTLTAIRSRYQEEAVELSGHKGDEHNEEGI
jgi:hypothetical protein